MLLAFLYHRVHTGKYSNSPQIMEEHLTFLKDSYPLLLPGEPISPLKTCICLTFDDAYFDFYHYVFPLLKKLKLRAVLGVPVKYILPSTHLKAEVRLDVTYKTGVECYREKAPFCTWKELQEMQESGHVEIASHSYSHIDLTLPGVDLQQEVVYSQKILEEKLQVPIKIFIYPLGKFNKRVHKEVMKHYSHAMRIGNACNFSWQGLTYRIFSDNLKEKDELLKKRKHPQYLLNFFLNRVRGR
ncbi:MAG TPA: polysaccharide deacetylase family protein [Chlamydiales bacterium]|nr:polysaccharide deacetylase family protein [Chlamydiales bacterium]